MDKDISVNDNNANDEKDNIIIEDDDGEIDKEQSGEPDLPPEPPIDTKEGQRIRSELGRRVSRIEDRMNDFFQKFDEFVSAKQSPPAVDELDDDLPITKKELFQLMEERERRKNEEVMSYQRDFIQGVVGMADETEPELHEKIVALMDKNPDYLKRYSNDGMADAERNYLRAERAILRQSIGKENPIKGNKPRSPLGSGVGSKASRKRVVVPDLDPYAKEYAEKQGMSEEDIMRALGKDAPSYIGGKA